MGKAWGSGGKPPPNRHQTGKMGESFIFLEGNEGKKEQAEGTMKDENRYKEVSDDILREMNVWNATHPKATFLEIEVKARELVSQLEAHLIQASALEQEREDWSQCQPAERPSCPTCQVPLLS